MLQQILGPLRRCSWQENAWREAAIVWAQIFSSPAVKSDNDRLNPEALPNNNVGGAVAEWSKAHAWKVCRRGTVSRVRIPSAPPLAHCKPKTRPQCGPFFFLSQRGLAKLADFRRLAVGSKSVSERPASLSIRPSWKSRRIKKVTHFQHVGEIELRRS